VIEFLTSSLYLRYVGTPTLSNSVFFGTENVRVKFHSTSFALIRDC